MANYVSTGMNTPAARPGSSGRDQRPPVLFKALKWLKHKGVRGSDRLMAACAPFWTKSVIEYSLSGGTRLAVPIGRRENHWDLQDIYEYESQLISAFCSAVRQLSDVTLFDCGADIGIFSAVVCSRCESIRRVLAFEPNRSVWEVLCRNIRSLPGGEPCAAAVSDFTGFGDLQRPEYDDTDHAQYLVRAESGIPVLTLDSYRVFGGNLAIKIDVEGGELNVLRGARETLGRASHCILSLEVHPWVFRRTGIGPAACMAFLDSIRPFRFFLAETGREVRISDDLIDPTRALNLVAVTPGLDVAS